MLEGLEIIQGALHQQRELAGVDLVAGDGEHNVTGVDQPAQDGHQQIGLQAEAYRCEELDIGGTTDQLGPVENLAVPLGSEAAEDFLGVARAGRLDAVAVEHFQGIQDDDGVLGAGAAGQCLQRVADELLAVGFGDQGGERRVLRCQVGKMGAEGQA